MKSLRGGRGLGDSIYLQSIARHLIGKTGQPLRVMSDYPDVFDPLGRKVDVQPFSRVGVDIVAHYVGRKGVKGTDQFEDMCLAAGIREPVDLTLGWPQPTSPMARSILSLGRPVVAVQLPRSPMGRTDGFGAELLPDCSKIQAALDALGPDVVKVQIGSGAPLHSFTGLDIDLAGRTTVREMIEVAAACSAFVGYPSFILPLAESLGRPALIIWSARGLKASHAYIRNITPAKLLHFETSRAVLDSCTQEEIEDEARALLQPRPSAAMV